MAETVLELNNLYVYYDNIPIVRDINLKLEKGEFLGIVGESGCGKTTLLKSLMMLESKGSSICGSIRFKDTELTKLSSNDMRKLRGSNIAMIPQNASAALDPTKTVSSLFYETIRVHGQKISRKESDKRASEIMERLMLDDTERILKSYPFELSGGMCQRVFIASAMVNAPELLLGDEPTSALDVTSQLEVVNQLKNLKENFGISCVLISHNMGVVAALADTIAVMYGGRIVEYAPKDELLKNPSHPYTKALIEAVPDLSGNISKGLDGIPPAFTEELKGCPFEARCPSKTEICSGFEFEYGSVSPGHLVGCRHFVKKEV